MVRVTKKLTMLVSIDSYGYKAEKLFLDDEQRKDFVATKGYLLVTFVLVWENS